MISSQNWFGEAALRLEDARALLDRDRAARAVSAAYFALLAAGKGALLAQDVEIDTHAALYKLLSKHFVRVGQLSDDTAPFIQDLYDERLAADYDLRRYDAAEARAWLDETEALIEQMEALI